MPFSPIPTNFGGALRLYHVLKHLAARHRVSVVTFGDPGMVHADLNRDFDLKQVRVIAHDTRDKTRVRIGQVLSTFSRHSYHQGVLVTRRFQNVLDELFAAETFDVLHTEFSHLGPVKVPASVRRVCDSHNVEYDIFARMAETVPQRARKAHYWLEYWKVRRDELKWCNQQDVLLTTSRRDAEVFRKDGVKVPIEVVPNGVDAAYFHPSDDPVEPHSIVFTGAMHYTPNYDGIEWFVREVLPKIRDKVPQVKFYVVGKDPPPHVRAMGNDHVVVTGSVDDVRPFVYRSAVYVVPLRIGGGTRLKVCEAMAMKKPMVSTRVGAEGIDVEEGKTILFADEPQAFADATVRLLADRALQTELAENAYRLMQEKYAWSVIGRTLDAVYSGLERSS